MKKFRKEINPIKIKVLYCGEYGDEKSRPHYHACIFGYDFPDKQLHKIINGHRLYKSEILANIWEQGHCTVGSLTFESAAYVARYCMKKITGEDAEGHYQRIDPVTGEINQLTPEFMQSSRGGTHGKGLAYGWLQKYQTDVYPSDQLIMNGKILKPPRYYDNQYQKIEPDVHTAIIKKRVQKAQNHLKDQTPERLAVREYVLQDKLNKLPRNHDKKAIQ